MMEMGRPKSTYPHLPMRMTARTLKGGKVLFYYTGRYPKKIALGGDYGNALRRYADLETTSGGQTFLAVSDRWEKEGIHLGKGGRPRSSVTQGGYKLNLVELRKGFGHALLGQIRPKNIREYFDERSKKVSANREIQVFSIIWNWARAKGITDLPNPTLGIDRNHEEARQKYVEEAEYQAIWERSPPFLQDAMDLALLTSQRPADVLKMKRQDMREGHLWLKQNKTGNRLGVSIEGELKTLLDRILTRPRAASSVFLIADDKGQAIRLKRLQAAWATARLDPSAQFRDIRAKAITDTESLREASQRAGHSSELITAAVYRRVKGLKVKPLR